MFSQSHNCKSLYIRKNLSLAWPLALNALLMQSMLMIDTLLISPLGEVSLAAMGIATTIVAFVLGIQMALANGTQLVLSRSVGSGSSLALNRSFCSGLFINVIIAIFFCLMISAFNQELISALTDDVELHQEINAYLSISKYLVLFNAVTQVVIAFFNARGRTRVPFKGYLIELPINIVCSYLLIYGVNDFSGLGLQGAAIGSVVAIVVRMAYLLSCIKFDDSAKVSLPAPSPAVIENMLYHFKEIFPVAANVTMLQIGATIYQLLYSQLTIHSYVAITLIMPWIRAGTQFITAWAHSSAITISQAIGSKKLQDLNKNVDVSIDIAVVISCLSAVFFLVLSLFLSSIYPELDDATYQALTVIAPLYILLPVVRGYNTVHGHILRALGKTTDVFKINFTGQWLIAIPLCALVILVFDGSIFWAFAIQPLEEIVKAWPFRRLARKSLAEFDGNKSNHLMYD